MGLGEPQDQLPMTVVPSTHPTIILECLICVRSWCRRWGHTVSKSEGCEMHSDKKPTNVVVEKIKEGKCWRSGVDHMTSMCKVLGSVSSKVINI